ncbi:MAG: oligosaccharide flippase family protein, partial [Erythrobacter sp.]|nr:oligosaccharide flippase family protein [Erythrobacter sp.]
IYGASHVAARGVTFLLLPIYTNIFSLEDYGIISLPYTFLGFMNVVLHYGLDASLLKHYMPADSEERKTILSNAYGSFLITTILFSLLLIIFRNNVSGLLFGINLPNITLLVVGILFFDVLWSIHVLILRLRRGGSGQRERRRPGEQDHACPVESGAVAAIQTRVDMLAQAHSDRPPNST